jgi:hypothetical protein
MRQVANPLIKCNELHRPRKSVCHSQLTRCSPNTNKCPVLCAFVKLILDMEKHRLPPPVKLSRALCIILTLTSPKALRRTLSIKIRVSEIRKFMTVCSEQFLNELIIFMSLLVLYYASGVTLGC